MWNNRVRKKSFSYVTPPIWSPRLSERFEKVPAMFTIERFYCICKVKKFRPFIYQFRSPRSYSTSTQSIIIHRIIQFNNSIDEREPGRDNTITGIWFRQNIQPLTFDDFLYQETWFSRKTKECPPSISVICSRREERTRTYDISYVCETNRKNSIHIYVVSLDEERKEVDATYLKGRYTS